MYGSILTLGTVFPRTLPREDTGTHPRAENIDNVPAMMHISTANTSRQAKCYPSGWIKLEIYKQNIIQTVLM